LFSETLQGIHEKRLLNDLLNEYNTLERPVADEKEPLRLSFGLTLMQIIDVVSFQSSFPLCEKRNYVIKDVETSYSLYNEM
jgi:hypothetical protein